MPLLLLHGFPDSFYRYLKIVPLLTDPTAHGADAADSFDVILPSLPGYGFSDRPGERGMTTSRMAKLFVELMVDRRGYGRFAAHGGDWGNVIAEQLAVQAPQSIVGLHLTNVPWPHLLHRPGDLSAQEEQMFARNEQWLQSDGAMERTE